jgi:hypothetical protein
VAYRDVGLQQTVHGKEIIAEADMMSFEGCFVRRSTRGVGVQRAAVGGRWGVDALGAARCRSI